MRLPRLNFSTGQLLLLTALVAICIALATAVYQRVRRAARPVAAAWSVDGKLAALRASDGRVRVYSERGQPLASVGTGQFWTIWTTTPTLAIIDEQHIATTGGDGKIEVWDVERGQRLGRFGSTFASPYWETASISRDGRRVASIRIASESGVDLWDVQQGVRAAKLKRLGTPQRLVLADDAEHLAMIEHNGTLSVVNVATNQRTAGPLRLLTLAVDRDTVALSGDLSTVAIAARDGAGLGSTPVVMLNINRGPPQVIAQVPGEVETLTLSPDGATLATASPTGEILLWRTADAKQLGRLTLAVDERFLSTLDLASSPQAALAFAPDGKSLLVATNTTAGVYDVPTLARSANLGLTPSRLGRWFFIPAFVVWAVLWGYAARRAGSVSSLNPPTTADDSQAEEIETTRIKAPRAMIAVWILLTLGGVWAIVWSMLVVFSDYTCLALTPFPYIGLYIGLRATAAGASRARSEFNLPGIALLQMFSFAAGDVVNPTLGLVNYLLLRRASVKQYRGERGALAP